MLGTRNVLLSVCLVIFVGQTHAEIPGKLESSGSVALPTEKTVWACAATGTKEEDLWLVSWGSNSYIRLYDVRVWGNHYNEGENLRWDVGDGHGGTAKYSAILKPNGTLDYYDFSLAEPGQAIEANYFYVCRLAQTNS